MKSKLKSDSFHIIKTISGEISLDFSNQNISKQLTKLIKSKNIRRKNRRKIIIKEQKNIIKKREPKIENIIANKIRKEFIPLPLISHETEGTEKKDQFPSSKLYEINNNSFSYINENNSNDKIKEEDISEQINNIQNRINNLLLNKFGSNYIYYYKNNFECKFHPDNKYMAYCSNCEMNICQKCLINNLSHIEHKIFIYNDIMPSEKQTKFYKALFLFSKNYLKKIKEIIIEIYNDLSEFHENDKNNGSKYLIENIQKQLKKVFKNFYIKNYYQLEYIKKTISVFCEMKDLQFINYQIINNLSDIKINSVKVPDLLDQHVIIKAKTMIEFMIYNSNNILKSNESIPPTTIYRYKSNQNEISVDSFNIEKLKIFDIIKNSGIIYKPNFQFNNNFITKYKNEEQYQNNINEKNNIINDEINTKQDKENNIKEILPISNENKQNIINRKNNIIEDDKNVSNNKNNIEDKNIKNNDNSINTIKKDDNILNNLDCNLIKKYIFENFPIPSIDDVEFKKDVPYLYYDKNLQKNINCKYHGEFKKNTLIRHGRGLFIWEDGEYYLGYWLNDKREGKGINYYSNGDIYEGEYRNGKKEGKGIYKWKNGDKYEGDWRNDMKEGEGKYKCNNGDKYVGLFKMDKIEGNGLYIWANKNTYKGQFKNNEIEGKGILNYICTTTNREIKDMHNKITYQKIKPKQETNNNDKPNDDKKYIEIFTCDRSNNDINNSKVEK